MLTLFSVQALRWISGHQSLTTREMCQCYKFFVQVTWSIIFKYHNIHYLWFHKCHSFITCDVINVIQPLVTSSVFLLFFQESKKFRLKSLENGEHRRFSNENDRKKSSDVINGGNQKSSEDVVDSDRRKLSSQSSWSSIDRKVRKFEVLLLIFNDASDKSFLRKVWKEKSG